MALIPLSDDDVLSFRTLYIRDLFVMADATAHPPVIGVALSHYNRSVKANWIDDDTLQALAVTVTRAWQGQIAGVYDAAFADARGSGMSDADADAAALAIQKDAFFRLIRADVWERMMSDPGFVGSVTDEKNRAALFSAWKSQIAQDRTFTKTRTSGPFIGIPLEIF